MRPLHWTATEGGIPHASLLLQYGADVEATDGSGCTPLLIAAQYGQTELVAYLLQTCGANGRAVDSSLDSALHWAAYKGSIHVCGHLLYRNELSWTAVDNYGQTPLHLASLRGNTAVVRYLLDQGEPSDVRRLLNLPDKNGKTPLDLAIARKRPTVELVLRQHLAKFGARSSLASSCKSTILQLTSYHAWKLWMGCSTATDVDVTPKFPYHFMLSTVLIATLWYPLVFTPLYNTSSGILWDYMSIYTWNWVWLGLLWLSIYKIKTTSPGTLNNRGEETKLYRRLYQEQIEALGKVDEDTCVTKPDTNFKLVSF